MDTPAYRLNRFLAESGAGRDAAGRMVYSGPGFQYMGPGEFARTQAVHSGLSRDAFEDQDRTIQLLRRLAQVQANRGY